MSIETQRWTVQKVLAGTGSTVLGWRWTYTLRGGAESIAHYETAKLAAKAAERQWKRTRP